MSALLPTLLFALAAQAAGAEPAPATVVVVATGRTPALDAVAAEAEAMARVQLRDRSGFVVVDATAATREPSMVLAEARALVEEGEAAYAELETRAAVSSLERAVRLLKAELDRTGERELLVRALALLGSVHNQSGNSEEAEHAFLTLLSLAPTHSLDDGVFPPADVKLMERLQEDLAFTEPGSLEISSGDVPASVWLDGKLRGFTPLKLDVVGPGTHVWLVRRQGYLPKSGSISVDGKGAVERVRLVPPATDKELPSRIQRLVLERTKLHPTLLALTDAIGRPDELIAVVVEEAASGGPVLRIVRVLVEGGVLVGYREVPAGEGFCDRFDVALAELLDAPIPSASAPAVAATAADPIADEGEGLGGVFWIAGAAGGVTLAAVLAGGAALALMSLTQDDATPRPDDAHARARRWVVLGY